MALLPFVRQFTGTPYVYRAYVQDRETGRCIVGCDHKHRRQPAARRCADALTRAVLLKATLPEPVKEREKANG